MTLFGFADPDLDVDGWVVIVVDDVVVFASYIEISLFLSNDEDLPIRGQLSLSDRCDSQALSARSSFFLES